MGASGSPFSFAGAGARRSRCARASLLALCTLAQALPAGAAGGMNDPVYVFYPRGTCRENLIALEIWNRETGVWEPHSVHPQVPVNSCQLEDAGVLLNELRWRCIESEDAHPPAAWVVGLDVFDPEVMESCAVGRYGQDGDALIHISSPAPGETVRNPDPTVDIEGRVRMGGIDGANYDVLIAIDVSDRTHAASLDLLDVQVEAAHSFVRRLRGRLGPVRVGIVSYPNLRPSSRAAGGTGARRELAFSGDIRELSRALNAVRARGAAGFPSFASGFEFALGELTRSDGERPPRPTARKLLLLSADGRGSSPFGPETGGDEALRERLLARSEQAREARVAIHLFALGGLAEVPSAWVAEIIEENGSFRRVLQPDLARSFFDEVDLPYVHEVFVTDLRSGERVGVALMPDGRFSADVPVVAGPNPMLVTATMSDGRRSERELVVEFDDSLMREQLLEKERARMKRMRKQVEIEPERRRTTR